MPAKDLYHDAVVEALTSEGWTITDDPLRLAYGRRNLYVDLGAENLFAAVKGNRLIAVEIKSFAGASDMQDLEAALDQYVLYRDILAKREPDRILYLAVPLHAYEDGFKDELGQLVVEEQQVRLIVFDVVKEVILKWIP